MSQTPRSEPALRRALSTALLADRISGRSLRAWRLAASIDLVNSLVPPPHHLRGVLTRGENFWNADVFPAVEGNETNSIYARVEGLPARVATAVEIATIHVLVLTSMSFSDDAASPEWWPEADDDIVECEAAGDELARYASILRYSIWDLEGDRLIGLTLRNDVVGREQLVAQWNRYFREREHVEGVLWSGAVARATTSGVDLCVGEARAIEVIDAWWARGGHPPTAFVVARAVLRWFSRTEASR